MPEPRQRPMTPDDLKKDLPAVLGFLRLLEAAAPGRTVEELVRELEGLQGNPLGLELLARALSPGVK